MSERAIVVMFILCLLPGLAAAQPRPPISVGVKVGASLGSLSGLTPDPADLAPGASSTTTGRTGLAVGAGVSVPFNKNLAFQSEILFVQKGGGLRLSGPVRGSGETQTLTGTFKLTYLEIPILVKYTAEGSRARPYFFGGPSVGFRLSAKTAAEGSFGDERDSEGEIDSSELFEKTDFGVVVGGGIEIGRILGEARYTTGLSDISTGGAGIRNRSFLVLAGVRF